MAGFTPVTSMARLSLPDPIGVDQLKRRNALADFNMELDQRNALVAEQNAETYRNQLMQGAQARQADAARELQAEDYKFLANAGRRLLATQDEVQYKAMADMLSTDPAYIRLGGNRSLLDRNVVEQTLPLIEAKAGIAPSEPVAPVELQQQGDYSYLVQGGRIVPGSVQAPQRAAPQAPVRPDWQLSERRLPDGRVQKGFVDRNSPDPVASFKADGAPFAAAPSSIDQDRVWRGEDRMKNDFEQLTKSRREEISAAKKVRELAVRGIGGKDGKMSPQAQQALIFMFGKVLDPDSVLREGEYDRIAQARGYYDTAALLMDRVANGDLLTPKQVKDIGDIAAFYEQAARQNVSGIASEYERIAKDRGYDPSAIITDPAFRTSPSPKGGAQGGRKSASQYLQEAQRGR